MTLGLKGKIVSLVLLIVATYSALVGYALYNVNVLNSEIGVLGNQRIPISTILGDIRAQNQAVPRYGWLSQQMPTGSDDRKKILGLMDEASKHLVEDIEKYKTFKLNPEAKELVDELVPRANDLRELTVKFISLMNDKNQNSEQNAKALLLKELPPLALPITDRVKKLAVIAEKMNEITVNESEKTAKKVLMIIGISFVAVFVATLIVSLFFATKLARDLMLLSDDVKEASSQVSVASEQLSSTSEQLSQSSQEQASAVEEASASLTEISGMIEVNLKNTEDSSSTSEKIYKESDLIKNSLNEMLKSMETILESNQKIERLVKVIDDVGKKTQIIDDIVFKTQLLSFNASIEAERAGEHGRGFSVVAQEVGNLAQLSGKAANEISNIVNASIKEAETISVDNKQKVEIGVRLAKDVNEKVQSIMDSIVNVNNSLKGIVVASKEQSQGIGQISISVENINQSVQETASSSEESASASEELSKQAQVLLGHVNRLNAIIVGDDVKEVKNLKKTTSHNDGKVIKLSTQTRASHSKNKNSMKKAVGSSYAVDNSEDSEWEKI